jgi:hypothetical protein
MTNFLTVWLRKIPTNRETAAPAREEEFASAVAALRKATGTTEARVVPCRCAVTGQAFSLRFERLSPAHRFQIARIDKDDGAAGQVNTGIGLSGRKPPQYSYDAGEFDWTGFQCPACGNRSGLVYCNECGETVCGGRVRPLPDGSKAFACHDGCGATGTIGPAAHVRGGAGESRPAIDQSPLLPRPSAAPAALPDGFSGRLPRPRRQ